MNYFFDFDRTLFDTDAFNISLADEPGCAPFKDILQAAVEKERDGTLIGGVERQRAWELVTEALACGDLSFSPGYLSRFIYPDVPNIVNALGTRLVVMTYGNVDRQRAKLESALPELTSRVIYTGDLIKADALRMDGYDGAPAIFVDDRAVELEACAAVHPALMLYEIRRDGKEGDGRWPVIRSLNELPVA